MAGLIKQGKRFYARVRMPTGHTPREFRIPLLTGDEMAARARRLEVERRELDIKAGLEIVFPWQEKQGQTVVKRFSTKQAVKEYLQAREREDIRVSTLNIYQLALKDFMATIGRNFPVQEIGIREIDKYKAKAKGRLSPTTINIRLRAIRTFLFWLRERQYLESVPRIRLLNTGNSDPIYISNAEFSRICDQVPEYLKRVFLFYRETGCRLSEPFYGEVNGNWLTVKAETAKGKRSRDIPLTDSLRVILDEMRAKTHRFEAIHTGKSPIRKTHGIKFYSQAFQKACKAAGVPGKKFHSLRHTFAVREYLRTRDIYHVAGMLGHASVTTTEIYSRFNLKRLEQDFPDLVKGKNWEVKSA